MRRTGFSLLIVLLLAACSGVPQKTTRGPARSATSSAGAYRTTPPGFPNFVDHTVGREEISIQAMSLVGVPYRWGGNTPDSGFDCSGLVRYVVSRAASVNLPRTTADMSSRGESVEPDEIATGDLIFFNTTGRPHSHVGIYVGKLRFVNAPSTGGTVRIDYLTNPYWAKRFDGIRRVAPPASKPVPFDTPTYQASVTPESNGSAPSQMASRPPPAQSAYGAGVSSVAGGTSAAPLTRAVANTPRSMQPAAPPATLATAPPPAGIAAVPAASRTASAADPFEPPPPGMTAAQMQARAAGATSPAAISAAQAQAAGASAYAPPQSDVSTSSRPPLPSSTATPAPDAIDAAADAFEPPPPAAVAARQAQQAQQEAQQIQQPSQPDADGGVRIMRASTTSRPLPAPTQTGDDPIARFANGSF